MDSKTREIICQKIRYEEWLNELYTYEDIKFHFGYLIQAPSDVVLAQEGRYGTLLMKNDPVGFDAGFRQWENEMEIGEEAEEEDNCEEEL